MKNLHTLDKYRLDATEYFGSVGDSRNGAFKVRVNGRSFFCIASTFGGWEHVSVSPCNTKRKTCPTWEEMCEIKDLFFTPEETVVQYHPPKSDYVNIHPLCLHLWKPTTDFLPAPPSIFV